MLARLPTVLETEEAVQGAKGRGFGNPQQGEGRLCSARVA